MEVKERRKRGEQRTVDYVRSYFCRIKLFCALIKKNFELNFLIIDSRRKDKSVENVNGFQAYFPLNKSCFCKLNSVNMFHPFLLFLVSTSNILLRCDFRKIIRC